VLPASDCPRLVGPALVRQSVFNVKPILGQQPYLAITKIEKILTGPTTTNATATAPPPTTTASSSSSSSSSSAATI
jgi:hypothetical protein